MNKQVRLVNDVDCWAQDNDVELEKQFAAIYRQAGPWADGWQTIYDKDPFTFDLAYRVASKHAYKMNGGY